MGAEGEKEDDGRRERIERNKEAEIRKRIRIEEKEREKVRVEMMNKRRGKRQKKNY